VSYFDEKLFYLIKIDYKSNSVYSIQCCVGDSSCSEKPADCPSNVCYKFGEIDV
jgi:hypothetical protein